MVRNSRNYDITQFHFDENMQDLADRTARRLYGVFAHAPVPREHLYYAAASAVECLQNRRTDLMRALGEGAPVTASEAEARIGRIDAHFYFRLARSWTQAALSGRQTIPKRSPWQGERMVA